MAAHAAVPAGTARSHLSARIVTSIAAVPRTIRPETMQRLVSRTPPE